MTFNDSQWESVCVPHDWAIYGPFDRNNDLQNVAITQNLEKQASVKTGRTGGLPYVGVGWYRTRFDADPGKTHTADGKDLAYVTVRVVDKDGNLCPTDMRLVKFKVKGAGSYKASANGDPTCLDLFHLPRMHAFNGMLTAIVQSGKEKGTLELQVTAKGVKSGKIQIEVK